MTGIPIRVNVTLLLFLPLLAWIISRPDTIQAYADLLEAVGPHAVDADALLGGTTPWVIGTVAAVGLFVGVTLHELGHAWTARHFGVGITSITLWIFGGLARLEDVPEDWRVEFWIAIAGPATSVAVAGVAWVAYLVVPPGGGVLAFVVGWLAVINVVLAGFNLLPAFPMDGGRVLRALLARKRPYVEATRTAAAVGKGFAVVLAILGILALAPLLVLVALFVYIAATGESRETVLRDLLRGVTVRDVMTVPEEAIQADASVQLAVEEMMRRRVTGFPVVDASGAYAGLVTLAEVRGVPPGERAATTVGEVARTDVPTVAPTDDAFDVLKRFASSGADRLAVVGEHRLVGSVTNADILAAIEIPQGLRVGGRDVLPGAGYP